MSNIDKTTYIKPNKDLWKKVNALLIKEDAMMGDVIVTFIGAMSEMLKSADVARTEGAARAYLAAMVISPEGRIGELRDLMDEALVKLAEEKGIT